MIVPIASATCEFVRGLPLILSRYVLEYPGYTGAIVAGGVTGE